jgi:hypothetical protein
MSEAYYSHIKDYEPKDAVVKHLVTEMKNIGQLKTVMIEYGDEFKQDSWNTV